MLAVENLAWWRLPPSWNLQSADLEKKNTAQKAVGKIEDNMVTAGEAHDGTVRSRSTGQDVVEALLGALKRAHGWISRPRIPLEEEYFEIYGMTNYTMTLGLVSHIFFVPLFWFLGVPFLALYNLLSVAVFTATVYLARRARFVASLAIGTVEVIVHAWLVTIWLGLMTFAHLFVPLALQLTLLLVPVAARARALSSVVIGSSYLSLAVIGIRFPPIVELPVPTMAWLGLLNVSIYLIVATGMAVYYAWTVKVTRKARLKAEEALEIARDQAIAAREKALDASRAKSTFLANMSHELRTPLNAIIGYSEMIAEDAPEDATREDARRIESSGRHLLSLINEVLDLSKIEAGRMEVSRARIALDECLAPVLDTARPLAEKGGNLFEVTYDNPPSEIETDVLKLRQVLLNLLSNACKFTQSGVVSLHVAGGRDRHGATLRMTVADSGIGISKEALGKIFEEFVQADASTAERYGGTGLGLPLAKAFCELLGGSLVAFSEVGKGSQFVVVLPVVVPVALSNEERVTPPAAAANSSA